MGRTLNQCVKHDAGSRQRMCSGAPEPTTNGSHLARSDWSAGVRTRGIDWLEITRSRAHAYVRTRLYCKTL